METILKVTSWLMILGLVIATVVPADDRPMTGLQPHFEHLLAFGLAGLTFGLAYARNLWANLLSAFFFALALELLQIPLPTRHARLRDFIIDAAASCLGIVIAHLYRKLIKDRVVTA
jgi:VanZ family protein